MKATPANRTDMHQDILHAQVKSLKKQSKIYGSECFKQYHRSPSKYNNKVLEKRIYEASDTKKRAQTAKRRTVSFSRDEQVVDDSNLKKKLFGKSEFSNPNERPQIFNTEKRPVKKQM